MQKQRPQKENEKTDLCLFGSQINLCERPRVNSRNGSLRSSSVCSRRPMSAVPAFGSQVSLSERFSRRPLSADSPYTPGEFMWASHFRVSDHQDGLTTTATSSAASNEASTVEEKGSESDFGATVTLPSVLLLEDLTSEDFGRTWTDVPTARTEHSEDQCRSEKSLGQRIMTMAQQTSQNHDSLAFCLEKKPPLPFPKPILSKGTYKKPPQGISVSRELGFSSIATNCTTPKQSSMFDDKSDVSKSTGVTEIDSRSLSSTSSLKSDKERSKKHSDSSVPVQCFETNCKEAADNIQNEIANGELVKDAIITGESTSSAIDDGKVCLNVMTEEERTEDHDHLVDLKFQRWFQDTARPLGEHLLSRRVWEAEQRTEILLEQLVTEELLSPSHVNPPLVSVDKSDATCVTASTARHEQMPASEISGLHVPFQNRNVGKVFDLDTFSHQRNVSHPRPSLPGADDRSWMATHDVPEHDVGTLCCGHIDSSTKNVVAELATQVEVFASKTKESECSESSYNLGHNEETTSSSKTNQGESVVSVNTTTLQDTEMKKLTAATIDPAIDSTYNDIVDVLKFMEQEETGTLMKLDRLTMSPQLGTISGSISADSNSKNTSPASGKLKDILSFLDEVDQCCESAVNTAKNLLQTPRNHSQGTTVKSSGLPRLDELLQFSVVDLAHQVLTLQLQLEERNSSLNVLQDALAEQRQNALGTDKELRARLREQKRELEAAISRHQKFIDQLIAEKKTLGDKCESLVAELRKAEERFGSTLRAVEERHTIELQRAKEMHAAAEKLRRERWIDNKTQKIKEMTVKGLEPELQRMTTRHQQELSDLRALHKQELEEVEVRAMRRATQHLEQLAGEREEALARDKEQLRQRLEKQLSDEEERYQELRRRLMADVQHEKERLVQESERAHHELEETKRNVARESERAINRARTEFREALEGTNHQHQNDLQLAKEAMEAEKEAWAHAYKKQQASLLNEKETEIRDQLRRERDKEIELVIERLESEAAQSRAELEQAADNRLRRLKEKHDAEVKDLEASETAIKSKYNSVKQRLMECEDQLIGQQAQIRQLEKELQEARKIMDRLSEERAAVKDVVQREVSGQLLALEQEIVRMREEAAEARVRAQLELAGKEQDISALTATKEREMQQVYHRVKLAVAKKDEAFQQLKKQYEGALERCCHLEKILEQQRREFLLK